MSQTTTRPVVSLQRQLVIRTARRLFSSRGVDRVRFDQVAKSAGIQSRLLKTYATDKKDLLVLMFNDRVSELIEEGSSSISQSDTLVENLISFSKPFFAEFGKDVAISRAYLQMNFFSRGLNSSSLEQNRQDKLAAIRRLVQIAQGRREIRADIDPGFLAMHLLLLQSAALRGWISSPAPVVAEGVRLLASLVADQLSTLAVGPAEPDLALAPARRRPHGFPGPKRR